MARLATVSAVIVLIVLTGSTGCDSDPTGTVGDLTFTQATIWEDGRVIRFRSVY